MQLSLVTGPGTLASEVRITRMLKIVHQLRLSCMALKLWLAAHPARGQRVRRIMQAKGIIEIETAGLLITVAMWLWVAWLTGIRISPMLDMDDPCMPCSSMNQRTYPLVRCKKKKKQRGTVLISISTIGQQYIYPCPFSPKLSQSACGHLALSLALTIRLPISKGYTVLIVYASWTLLSKEASRSRILVAPFLYLVWDIKISCQRSWIP